MKNVFYAAGLALAMLLLTGGCRSDERQSHHADCVEIPVAATDLPLDGYEHDREAPLPVFERQETRREHRQNRQQQRRRALEPLRPEEQYRVLP